MNPLINDLHFLYSNARARCAGAEPSFAYERLLKFIEDNIPWYPPQQEGYGPWIEYKTGDPGPRVNDVTKIISAGDRVTKSFYCDKGEPARKFSWVVECSLNKVVAYCVKNKVES